MPMNAKPVNVLTNLITDKSLHHVIENEYNDLPIEREVELIINYYESIISCMPGNVYWLDKFGNAIGCNKNVLDMFGFKNMSEFTGLSFEEMGVAGNWLPEATQSFKKDTLDVIQTGMPKLNIEEPPIPHSDGRVIYFLTSRVPLFDRIGTVIGVVGISIDITERKQMEESLKQAKLKAEGANHSKSLFLANVSHDIKTPLTGIISLGNYLARTLHDPAQKNRANTIVESGLSLLNFMNEIIEISREDFLQIGNQMVAFDLKQLMDDIVALVKPSTEQKNLNFDLQYDPSIPEIIIGNRIQFYRILLNLISNAIKFTKTGGIAIDIKLDKENSEEIWIKVAVTDTGIGIPNDKLAIIFEKFTRLDPAYHGLYKGSGLGLSIVKQFIDDMQGKIQVESKEDRGSTFTCVLPFKKISTNTDPIVKVSPLLSHDHLVFHTNDIAVNAKEMKDGEKDDLPHTNAIKVLLVEDHLIATQAVRDILSLLNCHIEVASTGKEALHLFEADKYDLVLMDLGLPDMEGEEVTKILRKIDLSSHIQTPICALSAHMDAHKKASCLSTGFTDVFAKPLLYEQAVQLLARYCGQKLQNSYSSVKR